MHMKGEPTTQNNVLSTDPSEFALTRPTLQMRERVESVTRWYHLFAQERTSLLGLSKLKRGVERQAGNSRKH
jgi:hypothetical protein